MITACLISSTMNWQSAASDALAGDELTLEMYDAIDGPSEEEAYLAGD
jgi:hypothetical protein